MENLFQQQGNQHAPLADKLRPSSFKFFVGQEDLVGKDSILRKSIESDQVPSMILWGPPGSGKTTLAFIIASKTKAKFVQLSAVAAGKKELKVVLEQAKQDLEFYGATTENPSFEVISALLSRCQVFVLKGLSETSLQTILKRAAKELGIKISKQVVEYLANLSNGDARTAINTLEFAHQSGEKINKESIKSAVEKTFLYDKQGEQHFNMISALHKSMRASDPDAALYWLARMLSGGEDPLYVARRVIRFASEDVGNTKPTGLVLAVAAYQACHYLGMPECNLALAQAVEYLAKAPKSRSLDSAWAEIMKDIKNNPNDPVPMHLRNAPTKLMKELGYGKKEQESNLPANLKNKKYLA